MQKELQIAYFMDRQAQNGIRIKQQQIIFDFYTNDTHAIKRYLDEDLLRTFPSDYLNDFQRDYVNFVPKLIKQMAVVYREPAERNLTDGQQFKPKDANDTETLKAKAEHEEKLDQATQDYINLLPDDINTVDKEANRYAKAFTTSLTRTRWDDGKIAYDVMGSHLFNVKTDPDNPYKLLEVSYVRDIRIGDDEIKVAVFWTADQHWMCELVGDNTDTLGDKVSVTGRVKGDLTNYYGVIPFAVLRLEKTGDFWGNGAMDIVDANRNINVLLTDLSNATIMQAWGTPVLINMDIGGQAGQAAEANATPTAKKVLIGPKNPVIATNANTDMHAPSFSYVNASPMIQEVWDLIDSKIKMIASVKGINPNSFLAEAKATSGYSKIIDSLEQLELRMDDIEPCLVYEKDRFRITRAITNYHNGSGIEGADKNKLIDEKLDLTVDFAEIKIPETAEERIADRDWKIEKNLISHVDLIREYNPDLTIEEAEKRLAENKAIKEKYGNVPVMPIVEGEEDEQAN